MWLGARDDPGHPLAHRFGGVDRQSGFERGAGLQTHPADAVSKSAAAATVRPRAFFARDQGTRNDPSVAGPGGRAAGDEADAPRSVCSRDRPVPPRRTRLRAAIGPEGDKRGRRRGNRDLRRRIRNAWRFRPPFRGVSCSRPAGPSCRPRQAGAYTQRESGTGRTIPMSAALRNPGGVLEGAASRAARGRRAPCCASGFPGPRVTRSERTCGSVEELARHGLRGYVRTARLAPALRAVGRPLSAGPMRRSA